MTDELRTRILEWRERTLFPYIYDHLDTLLPKYGFVRRGDRWVSPLKLDLSDPRHPRPDKTYVLVANPSHLCEQGGPSEPVINILMRERGLDTSDGADYYRFLESFSAEHSLGMPTETGHAVQVSDARKDRDILAALRDYFQWCLLKMDKASATRAYLRRRGFDVKDSESLGFGFVPRWEAVVRRMAQLRFSREDVNRVCPVPATVGESHVLAIPYVCSGVLKGFIFRAIRDGIVPKYTANAGLDRRSSFFNYPEGGSRVIIAVEGEMDALTAASSGIPGVVSIGGSTVRRGQAAAALRAGTEVIVLCLDLDTVEDGKGNIVPNIQKRFQSVMRSVSEIRSARPGFEKIYIARFDEPADPDSYIREKGKDAFLSVLRNAQPWWRYFAGGMDAGLDARGFTPSASQEEVNQSRIVANDPNNEKFSGH